jgi:hypothetical protein
METSIYLTMLNRQYSRDHLKRDTTPPSDPPRRVRMMPPAGISDAPYCFIFIVLFTSSGSSSYFLS